MRTAALERALQISPRNCSKEAARKGEVYKILVKGKFDAIKVFC